MVNGSRGRPAEEDLRKALTAWAFNSRLCGSGSLTGGGAGAGVAGSQHPRRRVIWHSRLSRARFSTRSPGGLTGRPAAAATVQRQRGVLVNLAEYAVERGLLLKNPLTAIAWKVAASGDGVDRRVVVNPEQARALLAAVRRQTPSGPSLVAFFGAMYFGALRPAEAPRLRKANLALPEEGWGELLLESSTPEARLSSPAFFGPGSYWSYATSWLFNQAS